MLTSIMNDDKDGKGHKVINNSLTSHGSHLLFSWLIILYIEREINASLLPKNINLLCIYDIVILFFF